MIPKIPLLLLIVSCTSAFGASYSKVYVQNGAEVLPIEYDYLQYAPGAYGNPHWARLAAAPYSSVISLPALTPCNIPPCLYTGPTIPETIERENIIAYKAPAPSVPVVVAAPEPTGYEYAYVVYDEGTGDQKSQREMSDGSKVLGEYSFLQPDGYIREVKYIADEQTGFNAVVKNFLPEVKKTITIVPCADEADKKEEAPSHEALKHESAASGEEKSEEPAEEPSSEHSDGEEEGEKEESSAEKEPNESAEKSEEETHSEETKAEAASKEETSEHEKPKHLEKIVEKIHDKAEQIKDKLEELHGKAKKVHDNAEKVHDKAEKIHDKIEKAHEIIEKAHEKVESAGINPVGLPNIPYQDIVKCIQAAVQGAYGQSAQKSPLTYIILNKPC